MGTFLAICGAAGGLVVTIVSVVAVVRAIFRQVSSTDANTRALRDLTGRIDAIQSAQVQQGQQLANHTGRLDALERRP